MFELEERDRLRQTYQVCRLGFGTLSLALVLATLTLILLLAFEFTRLRLFHEILTAQWYRWIDTPIIWASLLGATLLWGRWDNPSWQRRIGLLLVMSLADIVLWAMTQGSELEIFEREFGHEWLRYKLGQALGWAELALISTLACDYLVHLGVTSVKEMEKSIRSLITTGAAIWLFLFFAQTNWKHGWPLQGGRFVTREGFLLTLAVLLIQTIVLMQVTALTLLATRQSTRMLQDLDREDPYREFLRPGFDIDTEESKKAVAASLGYDW